MTNGQRVLVVDGLAETEQVLKAVLEPQGLKVNRIRTHFPQDVPSPLPPHVVILHEDPSDEFPAQAESWADVPRVIIGSVAVSRSEAPKSGPREQYLSQPFHYGELIQAVETLLNRA